MILKLTTYFNGIVYYHLVLLLYQQFEVFICYLSKHGIVRWVSKTPLKLPHNKLNKQNSIQTSKTIFPLSIDSL